LKANKYLFFINKFLCCSKFYYSKNISNKCIPDILKSLATNTTRGLNFDHKIKARAHKRDMRIGKTPKTLASICCPHRRETKADTLKATEANGRRGPGTREKVRSKRINLEGNTYAQEINVSQLPI
jgi:hypothetical protein